MEIKDIPFSKHIGIEQQVEGTLQLEPKPTVQNHLNTIHASAEYTLAETQTGLFLKKLFPEYRGKVLPLLRSSTVKYKHPANTTITAHANVEDTVKKSF